MFKEKVRQPLVVREGKIIGVVTLKAIFDELIEIVGPECGVRLCKSPCNKISQCKICT